MTEQYSNYLTALANRDNQLSLLAIIAAGYVTIWFLIQLVPVTDQVRKIIRVTYLVGTAAVYLTTILASAVIPPGAV
jgi:hypothetical protein